MTDTETGSGAQFPFTPDVVQHPFPHFARLRVEAPVYQIGDLPFKALSRHADLAEVSKAPELFLNGRGSPAYQAIDYFPNDPQVAEVYSREPSITTLGHADGADHTRQRKLVSPWFTPRAIRSTWQVVIDELTDELISSFEHDGSVDMMKQFSIPLPVRIIARILGFDESSVDDLKRWSDSYLKAPAGSTSHESWMKRAHDHVDGQLFFKAQIADRLEHPEKEDLLAFLVSQTREGGATDEALSLDEVQSIVNQLLVAGNETTTQLIGQTMHAIVSTPGVFERLRENPDLVDQAVEEGLRFTSPVTALYRSSAADATIAGVPVPKDTVLLMLWASANHDEAVFERPEDFDIDRPNVSRHMAFGNGIHVCVGANLARAEARAAIRALVTRLPNLRVDPNLELDYGTILNNRALETLPMSFDPAH